MNQEGTTVESRAATLPVAAEDEDAGEIGNAGTGLFYCWPVWRFGRVFAPVDGQALKVETAQEIGVLFEPGRESIERYLNQRLPALAAFVERAGGELLRTPDSLPGESKPVEYLREHWAPERVLVTYSFVPIVRLPSFLVKLNDAVWLLRESLTICGHPAKSKLWVTASLIAVEGRPTDLFPLSAKEIDMRRASLEAFRLEALASLKRYYLSVLVEDSRVLALAEPVRVTNLTQVAETEILGVSSKMDVSSAFEDLEEEGMRKLRSRIDQKEVEGAELMGDFLTWTDQVQTGTGDRWALEKPMILAIYAEQPSCGSVRALVTTRTTPAESKDRRVLYVALTEVKNKPAEVFPLSEAAARSLAKEYGRYF